MARFRRNLIRASLVLALLIGTAEVGLRLMGLGNPVLTTTDPACGYLFAPNQQCTRFGCTNHLNQYSMRSDDITPEKPAGTYRILMIGDSVLYGTTYVDQSKIFSTKIQQDLPAKLHESVQVLNASCGGWASGNELAYLTSRGTFNSDMVVLVMNTGDLEQIINTPDVKKEYITQKPFCALTELWSHYLSPRLFPAPPHVDAGSVPMGDGQAVYQVIDSVLANVSAARQFANAHHAGFAVLFSPALGGPWDTKGYQYGYARLQSFVADNTIPMVDLTPAYHQLSYDQLYDSGNIHLKPAGHDIVAKTFVDAAPALEAAVARQLEATHTAAISFAP
jgi:hypothetical protein